MFDTNYFGAARCIQAVLPKMRAQGSGCIVNVTSIAGIFPSPNQIPYSASKFALEAATGKELWKHGNFNPKQQKNWRVIASAAATNGIAIVPFGRGDFVTGVRMGGSGDTTEKNRLWTIKGVGSDSTTPVAVDGKFYVLNDKGPSRGMVTCVNAKTGKKEWQSKLPRSAAIYYASPLIAGNKLYAGRSDGTLFCGTMTPEGLTDVVENELEDTLVASPIAVGTKLLVRTHGALWCFE